MKTNFAEITLRIADNFATEYEMIRDKCSPRAIFTLTAIYKIALTAKHEINAPWITEEERNEAIIVINKLATFLIKNGYQIDDLKIKEEV